MKNSRRTWVITGIIVIIIAAATGRRYLFVDHLTTCLR